MIPNNIESIKTKGLPNSNPSIPKNIGEKISKSLKKIGLDNVFYKEGNAYLGGTEDETVLEDLKIENPKNFRVYTFRTLSQLVCLLKNPKNNFLGDINNNIDKIHDNQLFGSNQQEDLGEFEKIKEFLKDHQSPKELLKVLGLSEKDIKKLDQQSRRRKLAFIKRIKKEYCSPNKLREIGGKDTILEKQFKLSEISSRCYKSLVELFLNTGFFNKENGESFFNMINSIKKEKGWLKKDK